jgi:hypothetical protein
MIISCQLSALSFQLLKNKNRTKLKSESELGAAPTLAAII